MKNKNKSPSRFYCKVQYINIETGEIVKVDNELIYKIIETDINYNKLDYGRTQKNINYLIRIEGRQKNMFD